MFAVTESRIDQPSFRRLICQSDLKFLPLGTEYNTIWLDLLDIWPKVHGAPRVLHVRELHGRPAGDPELPISLEEAIGAERAEHVENLIAADWSLGGDRKSKVRPPVEGLRESLRLMERDLAANRTTTGPPQSGTLGFLDKVRGLLGRAEKEVASPKQDDSNRGRKGVGKKTISPYWSAVLAVAGFRSPLRICIVGANDGKFGDPIFRLIKSRLASETDILLFEPQPYIIPYLSENYAFHPSHHIVNAAIGPGSDLVLHAVRKEAWERFSPAYAENWPVYRAPTGVTSTERRQVLEWVKKQNPDERDPDALVAELRVPCSTLVHALERLGRPMEIDVLQVDAEGFDDEVIYACDINRTRPAVIYFEDNHLPVHRRRRLREHLEPAYHLLPVRRDVLAIRRHQENRVATD